VLPVPPAGAVADLDIAETSAGQPGAEVDAARPGQQPLVTGFQRFPAGQHGAATGRQDPAELPVGSLGLRREFVLGRRYAVSGAQPPELLAEALDRAWVQTIAATAGDQPQAPGRR